MSRVFLLIVSLIDKNNLPSKCNERDSAVVFTENHVGFFLVFDEKRMI